MDAPFTNVQLELLKIFNYQLPEEELLMLRKVLVNFFAERLSERASKIWEEKNYSQNDMEMWLADENQ